MFGKFKKHILIVAKDPTIPYDPDSPASKNNLEWIERPFLFQLIPSIIKYQRSILAGRFHLLHVLKKAEKAQT